LKAKLAEKELCVIQVADAGDRNKMAAPVTLVPVSGKEMTPQNNGKKLIQFIALSPLHAHYIKYTVHRFKVLKSKDQGFCLDKHFIIKQRDKQFFVGPLLLCEAN